MIKAGVYVASLCGAAVLGGAWVRVDSPLPGGAGQAAPSSPMAAADLDGDGLDDLVIGHIPVGVADDARRASTFLSRGDGTFDVVPFPLPDWRAARRILLEDFDGDGVLDAAIGSREADGLGPVVIYLGEGDGTFSSPVDEVGLVSPGGLAAGDIDGDDILDLVFSDGDTQTLIVALGRGDGTFVEASVYRDRSTPDIALGDFNGDDALDVVLVRSGEVQILLNRDGALLAPSAAQAGAGARALATADFDGDGRLDVVTANPDDDSVTVLFGRGNGTLGRRADYDVGDGPSDVAVGYVDRDRFLDVVTTNTGGDSISVLSGGKRGRFHKKAPELAVGDGPAHVAVADVAGNDRSEIVTVNPAGGTITVLRRK